MDTDTIRKRLTELNTKAYYLLVGLSFLYSKNSTLSLKLALTLTAVVAVLPVQDRLESQLALSIARCSKTVLLALALCCAISWVWCAAVNPTTAAQQTEQQKLKERVDTLQSQLKEAQAKADSAAFEKDRIDKIQQHYEDYYEKVHTTEMHVLETVTAVFALFVGFAALFGFSVFAQRIQNAVSKAIAQERANLQKSNAAQMKQLEDDLKLRSDWQFQFLQGMASVANKEYIDALHSFRKAVEYYKSGKCRDLLETNAGEIIVANLFYIFSLTTENEADRDAHAQEELKNKLFDDLEGRTSTSESQSQVASPPPQRKNIGPASSLAHN